MLNILRKRAQSTLIQGLVLLIAVVFIFWGVGSNLNNNRSAVATVNGVEIPVKDYQRAYDRTVENYRQKFGGSIPPGLLKGLNIKSQVVGQLVQGELIRQGAAAMGIAVSTEATQREIQKNKAFQLNGKFDLDRYKEILSQNRLTPTSFEAGIRNDMLTRMTIDSVGSFALLSDAELQQWLDFAVEEIKIGVKAVKSVDFEDKVVVEDSELAAWYEQHSAEYTTKPKIRLKYVFFDFAKDLEQLTITNELLKARYERDLAKYKQPEERHVRHILFKVSKEADDSEVAAKEKQAEEVLALARTGEDFAGLASEYSEGPTKDRGGDLGFFTRGQMVPAFDTAVFSMKVGGVSGLVRTSFGFHIIKLEEIKPATTRTFDEVKGELAKSMQEEEVKGVTFKKASAAYEGIMRAGNIDKYSQESGVKLIETGYFSRSDAPSGVTADPAFLQAAFSLGKGELSSLAELENGYAILFVDDIQTPEVPALADVRQRVEEDYRAEKAVDLARAAADAGLASAREQGNLAAEGVIESDYVKRDGLQAGTVPAAVIVDAFSLPPAVVFPEHVVGVGDDFYLYEIRDRRQDTTAASDDKKKQIEQQLLGSLKRQLVGNWLVSLQKKAKVWTNDTILQ